MFSFVRGVGPSNGFIENVDNMSKLYTRFLV